MINTSIAHYRITAKLGQGGMGEVYRATDTKLGREVAIKVLPASISRDATSLARFEREAKALAALNHPHIASIYGFDAERETHFLVLELVEGQTLSERLRRGSLPLDEALRVARQIAEAVEAAHAKGIIHRDLKPGNIKLTPEGRVKVLDFGLAKIEESVRGVATPASDPDAPTLLAETTQPGVVMGTPAYMSPEQARGQEVDKRTDVWAFGCCLFECLAGSKPFRGDTVTDLMAEVLRSEPDWSALPAEVPREVATLLRRCLEKDPRRRLSSLGDIAITLEETTRMPSSLKPASSAQVPSKRVQPALVALLLLLIGAGIFFWKQSGLDRNSQGGPDAVRSNAVPVSAAPSVAVQAADQKSIAVLAFANLSEDKGNESFSEGVSEELLNVLAKIPGLKVTARTSAFHFKGKDTPIPEIARQLSVAYVVEGSVRKAGDKVRITAQLIKAADGFHVWSDTFPRDLKDIFAVQEEIAGLIAQQLQLKLGMSSRATQVVNPEAYRLVLEGHHFWLQRTEEALARAEAAYRQALEHDPQFAQAHAGLAEVWMIRGWYRAIGGVFPPDDDFARAKSEAQLALRLDPTLAEPHATLGGLLYNERKFAESEQAFQGALRLNPNYSFAHHWRAHLLMATGKLDVALEELDRAVQLDPLSFVTLLIDSMWLSFAGRYEEALALNDRALALGPEGGFVPTRAERSLILLDLGRKDEAVAAARMISNDVNRQPRWWSDPGAIHVLHQAGLEQEAEDYATRFLATLPANSYVRSFVSVALGRNDDALAQLSQSGLSASAVGSVFYTTLWDGVRKDPRFLPIIAKLGYAKEYQVARETRSRLSKRELNK